MPLFGPNTSNAIASGFRGQNLLEELQAKALENKVRQEQLSAAQNQRAGQMLVADALARVLGTDTQQALPFRQPKKPSAGAPPAAPLPPGAQVVPPVPGMPNPGVQMQPLPPPGGAAAPGMPAGGAPAAPPAVAPVQAPEPVMDEQAAPKGGVKFSWKDVLEDISTRKDVPSGVRFAAIQEIKKEMEAETAREDKNYQKELDREARLNRELDVLEKRYTMAGTNEAEKLHIKAQYDQVLERIRGQNRVTVAGMNIDASQQRLEAQLAQDRDIFMQRDATTRRGQDMLAAVRQGQIDVRWDEDMRKAAAVLPGVVDEFDSIFADAERLLNMPGLATATGLKAWLPTLPGTAAADFEKALNSLKAKIGFGQLSAMRAASPTGGALGNVSNQEVGFLQNTIRSLDLEQHPQTFVANLRAIKDHASRAKERTYQKFETLYGEKPSGGPVPAGDPAPDAERWSITDFPQYQSTPDGQTFDGPDGAIYIRRGNEIIKLQ